MNRQEHLLTIAMEECSEVAQRLSKALRFGLNEKQPGQEFDNSSRIFMEYNDLIAVLRMLGLDARDPRRWDAKREKVEHFLAYAETCGTLELAGPLAPSEEP